MKRKLQEVIRTTVIVVLVLSFTVLFVSRCGFAFVPVTTKYAYQPILKYRWENRQLVEHFPPEIPAEAKDVEFYYRAGYMQGGTNIELRMRLPRSEFDSIVQEHHAMSKSILDHLGKDKLRKPKPNEDPISLHFFTVDRSELTDEYQLGPLPAGYEIILLHLEGYWNHGKTAGIAVNELGSEVIYWAAAW